MEFWRLGKIAVVVAVSAGVALGPATPSRAQDASLPCKVLRCAAATNPAWTQIPLLCADHAAGDLYAGLGNRRGRLRGGAEQRSIGSRAE